ncbi:hypothetical protein E0493_11640 [Roseomonas sp. M0104]|uniref:Uncharacterized protein n=1 Tax=Teichococcus coralli TaxID=2545983 RepID=A0A845BF89_9PROT|nr:hypothetical protein [Pseudoroseomonas coralli]MXP63997.1 hypothetical protein [Pseudoroseomonas coralli]
MDSPALPVLLSAVERLDGMLALAHAFVQAGRRLDLDGLDAEITALCAAILALPREQRGVFGGALHGLQARILALQAGAVPVAAEA